MINPKHLFLALWVRNNFGKGDKKRDAGQTTPDDVVRYDNILYGGKRFKKWQLLDVYRPKAASSSSDNASLCKLPVIVIVHGGGWVYGDKGVYQFYGMRLAQRGFAVVNYSYRLAPEAKFPASMQDTESVFKWICDNADKYGLDAQNVFAVGDSAGAHLLALYAAALTNDNYRKNFPFIQNKNLCLRGLALNCGIYDIVAAVNDGGHTDLFVGALLPRGGKPDELKLINSVDYVTKDFPPTFVMSCKGDFLLTQAPVIRKILEDAGVLHEYKIYGTDAEPLWHVFHCDPKLQQAVACNDDECEFFKRLIAR